MTQPDQVHTAILRFLLQRGYRETQEAFVKEAGDKIDYDSVEDAPPVQQLLSRDPIDNLTSGLANLQFERSVLFDTSLGNFDEYLFIGLRNWKTVTTTILQHL